MQLDPADEPRLPADFTVDDILRAPLEMREGEPAAADERDPRETAEAAARSALWELDFALQELEWLKRGAAREGLLVRSIVSQFAYSVGCVERFPLELLPLPEQLAEELAERFGLVSEAIEDLPSQWADHEDMAAMHRRLRLSLERRGVEV